MRRIAVVAAGLVCAGLIGSGVALATEPPGSAWLPHDKAKAFEEKCKKLDDEQHEALEQAAPMIPDNAPGGVKELVEQCLGK